MPFLYTQEGFETEEIASLKGGNETWRRLKVNFPDYIKSHTREQISCFGPDELLRRHDSNASKSQAVSTTIIVSNFKMRKLADLSLLKAPSQKIHNTFEQPNQIEPEAMQISCDHTCTVVLAPQSVAIATIHAGP